MSRRFSMAWGALLLLLVVLFFREGLVTNVTTPSGDGNRVITYAEFVAAADSALPVWSPYSNAGMPTLADPERAFYSAIAPLLMAAGPEYYNLSFNLLLLAALVALALALYRLAMSLGVSAPYAALAAALVITSGLTSHLYYSGRLISAAFLVLVVALLPTAASWVSRGGYWRLLVMPIFAGGALSIAGYYALLPLVLFALVAAAHYRGRMDSWFGAARAGGALTGFSVLAGVLLFSFFLIPLAGYQLANVVAPAGDAKLVFPDAQTLVNMFLPLDTNGEAESRQEVFPHLSFAALGGLVLLLAYSVRRRDRALYALLGFSVVCLVVMLGSWLVGDHYFDFYRSIPVLSLIRHSLVYTWWIGVALAVGTAHALDRARADGAPPVLRVVGAGTLVLAVLLLIGLTGGTGDDPSLLSLHKSETMLWGSAAAVLVAVVCLGGRWPILHFFVYAAVILYQLIVPEWSMFEDWRSRADNHVVMPDLINTLNADSGYHRIGCNSTFRCPPNGAAKKRGIYGFSLYMMDEHKKGLSYLLGTPVVGTRPHWALRGLDTSCSFVRQEGLEMLNVRYLFCRKGDRPSGNEWEKVGEQWKFSLWRYAKDSPGVRVFDRWEVGKVPPDGGGDRVSAAWREGRIVLDRDPSIVEDPSSKLTYSVDVAAPNEETLTVNVTVNKPAVLFLPEYAATGWQATLDGDPVAVNRAYGVFQAYSVPAGESRIELHYLPVTLVVGGWVSVVAFFALFLGVGWQALVARSPK